MKEKQIFFENASEGIMHKWFEKFMEEYKDNYCEISMEEFFAKHDAEIKADIEHYEKKYGIKE